jgi:hypothetical protein
VVAAVLGALVVAAVLGALVAAACSSDPSGVVEDLPSCRAAASMMAELDPDDPGEDKILDDLGEAMADDGLVGREEISDTCAAMVTDLQQRYPEGAPPESDGGEPDLPPMPTIPSEPES